MGSGGREIGRDVRKGREERRESRRDKTKLTIAETPSMIIKMIQLRQKKAAKTTTRKMAPPMPDLLSAGPMVMDHSTAESC
jgi:hypothetical protein